MKLRWFILLSTQKSSVSLRSLQTIDHLVLTTTQSLVISNVYRAINRVEKKNLSLTRELRAGARASYRYHVGNGIRSLARLVDSCKLFFDFRLLSAFDSFW